MFPFDDLVKSGGVDTTDYADGEDRHGIFSYTYRGFYLKKWGWDGPLRIARVEGFDKWASSVLWEGPAPDFVDQLDAILETL